LSFGNLPAEAEAGTRAPQSESATARWGVCHVASGDRWAGAEVQIATLLKALARDERLQLSAILLNPGRLAKEIETQGIPVKVIPEGEHSFLGIVREASNFLANREVRILHSHRYKENLLAAWLANRCGIPYCVRTQHGLPEPQTGYRALKQGLIQGLDHLVARHATDRIISVSSEMTRQLTRRLSPQKVVTIPNGIDLEGVRSRFTAEEAKQRLGIPRGHQVIGTAGRLEPVKRLDIFLRAAGEIAAQRPNTRFVIAGEGREEARLKVLAQDLGVAGQVLFLGRRDDVYDVLQAFDVLLLSSDHEGLPMVLLEALYLSVVVAARAVGGVLEVIQNGTNGVLVDSDDPRSLADACVQVLAEPARFRSLAEAGVRSVTDGYGSVKIAGQVTRLYSSLIEQK
jgi:glycosyltransferase involved in cell wall biosynthesis